MGSLSRTLNGHIFGSSWISRAAGKVASTKGRPPEKSKKSQRYDRSGFSIETAIPRSRANHSAKSRVFLATRFAEWVWEARLGMPPGEAADLRRVQEDRSRAREKVEQGGAK